MIKAILLAAGQSKRLKSENKLIKKFKNKALINHSLQALLKSKVEKIIIVLGYQNKEVRKVIKKNKKNIFVLNKKFRLGMSSSINTGLKKISKYKKIKVIKNKLRGKFGSYNQLLAYERLLKKSKGDIIFY